MVAALGCDGPTMLVPDPAWSSLSCYDSRSSYQTSNVWSRDSFPFFPTLDGVPDSTRIEGEIIGDTSHGWRDPDGYHEHGFGLANVTQDGHAREDLTIGFFVFDPNRTCGLVNLPRIPDRSITPSESTAPGPGHRR